MSMKSKFNELLAMGALAQSMALPTQEGGSRKRRFSQGGTARFPKMDRKKPADWHERRTKRRKMQKASRKANRV